MIQDDHWQSAMPLCSKSIGLDILQEAKNSHTFSHESTLNPQNKIQKIKGITIIHPPIFQQNKNTSMKSRRPYDNNLKEEWLNIMKCPCKSVYKDILTLLGRGTMMEQKIWLWMLKNNQKINPKLYVLKRNKVRSLLMNPSQQHPKISSTTTTTTTATFSPSSSSASLPLLQKKNIIQTLQWKVNHPALLQVIGCFLLQREDIPYSSTIFNIAATFYYYSNSNQMKTFLLMSHVCASQYFIWFLTKEYLLVQQFITYIVDNLHKQLGQFDMFLFHTNQRITVEYFIQLWLESFFYLIAENGYPLKQTIISYLILHSFNIKALSKVCQATFYSLKRYILQGNSQKICEVLNSPKGFIDVKLFNQYLLCV